jgi:hypothetical protein
MVQFENIYQFNLPLKVVCIVVELVEERKIFQHEFLMELNNLLLTQDLKL